MSDSGKTHFDDPELARAERVLHEAEWPDDRAVACMFLGVFCERNEDWDSAVGKPTG